MSEIKFRAWMPYNEDPNDMRMEYDPQLFAEDGNGIFTINSVFAHPIDYFADNVTYPEAVIKFMQYTGMHDKNGREIYEGDIIVTHPKMKYEIPKIGVVQYGDCRPMFQYKSGDGEEYSIWSNNVYRTYEVIGNIFENPELLEAQHE